MTRMAPLGEGNSGPGGPIESATLTGFPPLASMVEAAARALHGHDRIEMLGEPDWAGLEELDRDSYRSAARAVLAAAFAECEAGGSLVAMIVHGTRRAVRNDPP